MNYSCIIGTGGYLPERCVPNGELEQWVNTSDQWIVDRTGIRNRHLAAEDQDLCDLAEIAARRALDAAHCQVQQIDLIVLGTTTPDRIHPSTACLLQARLGNHGAMAFDIQAVCSGFIYALSIADQFIRTGAIQTALVIGADIYSRLVDWTDRSTCILFGDGAGAVVLKASQEPGILSSHLHADGAYKDVLTVPATVAQGRLQGDGFTKMQGSEVFKFAVKALAEVVEEALVANQLNIKDIDWLVPHQANLRIITATAKKLGLPMEKVVVTLAEQGNTSAASIPLALDIAIRDGRIQRGHKLLLEAVGSGFTWGSILVKY
ncbi:3-oxoacyl-(acyl-carrier-protein) synthase III [Thioploca ingrica]|uniref:Beta-ketoacyl-[acyl-carrier-protein] synthase III n=1 Tax=Thioploca ingrica TaxID=40754 RepID=A0A090AK35_9GAMM|nr:3-oxoacyl-(acyl-carrier-protein) synthase III [Thioploca ingrica]